MKPKDYIILLGIIFINLILKSIHLDQAPFWYDEMISIKNTLLDFGHIKHEAEWDNNPPFYYYCLWVWLHIFDTNEFNARFLSVVFVSVAIGLVYVFSVKYFERSVALWTCLLLSLSNFIYYYSQEARAYSLVLFLSILSSLIFFRFIETRKYRNLFLLGLINFLLIYTHYISGLILLLQFFYLLVLHRKLIVKFSGIQLLVIGGLVLLRFTKKQFSHIFGYGENKDFWLQTATINDFKLSLSELLFNKYIALILVFTIILLTLLFRRKIVNTQKGPIIYCLLLGYVSILFLFMAGTVKPLFLARYLIFVIPFAILPFVFFLSQIKNWGNAALVLLSLFLMSEINFSKEYSMDYRFTAGQVRKIKSENDMVIVNTKDNLNLFCYYFDKEMYLKNKNTDSAFKSIGIIGVNRIEDLNTIDVNAYKRVFLIQTYHTMNQRRDIIGEYFTKTSKKMFHTHQIKGVEFSIFMKSKY